MGFDERHHEMARQRGFERIAERARQPDGIEGDGLAIGQEDSLQAICRRAASAGCLRQGVAGSVV
jgi:hypothetical protein